MPLNRAPMMADRPRPSACTELFPLRGPVIEGNSSLPRKEPVKSSERASRDEDFRELGSGSFSGQFVMCRRGIDSMGPPITLTRPLAARR